MSILDKFLKLWDSKELLDQLKDEVEKDQVEDIVEREEVPLDAPVKPMINNSALPFSLYTLVWCHTPVTDWAVSTPLRVRVDSNFIHLDYDGDRWKPVNDVSGNLWVIVYLEDKGFWAAATCEWLRHNQKVKQKKCVAYDHIKHEYFKDWSIKPGDEIYMMVSGLCRDNKRNVKERSEIVKVLWV